MKWRSAVIRRVHKDGSLKVIFRDGSSESHVPIERVAISKSKLQESNAIAVATSNEANANAAFDEAAGANVHATSSNGSANDGGKDLDDAAGTVSVADVKDFVVPTNPDDLESWIEKDEEVSIKILTTAPPSSGNNTSNYYDASAAAAASLAGSTEPSANDSSANVPRTATGGHILIAHFSAAPLGLTLSRKSPTCADACVIRVKRDSRAEKNNVEVGDILVQINEQYPIDTYEEAMKILPTLSYPIRLYFRKYNDLSSIMAGSTEMILKGSQVCLHSLI
jgi:hypothetical protein